MKSPTRGQAEGLMARFYAESPITWKKLEQGEAAYQLAMSNEIS
jgi:hypothetical protein